MLSLLQDSRKEMPSPRKRTLTSMELLTKPSIDQLAAVPKGIFEKGIEAEPLKPFIEADLSYKIAEDKARNYFEKLLGHVSQGDHLETLTKDFSVWKKGHVSRFSAFSSCMGYHEPDPRDSTNYLTWLHLTNRLEGYMDRSVSYIYMRDLGQPIDDPKVKEEISHVAKKLKNYIEKSMIGPSKHGNAELVRIFDKAKEEGLTDSMTWLMEKIKGVGANIPEGLDYEHTMRKMVKIIAGVTMHQMQSLDQDISPKERSEKLVDAVRLGYYYGLTYPFIDDLLDSNSALSKEERSLCSDLIKTTLETGVVPELKPIEGKNSKFIGFVYSELKESFEAIKAHQTEDNKKKFFEQTYVFYKSQEVDRVKSLDNPNYTNEDLYLPVILKSASSRLVARSILGKQDDVGFDQRTFYFGILNQMHDDMTDLKQDLKEGHVTPFTYYLKHHKDRPDLINPTEIYWSVVSNLIHDVYKDSPKVREMLLDRAINVHKGMIKNGSKEYEAWMKVFGTQSDKFNHKVQKYAQKSKDTYFFDKIMRQTVNDYFSSQKADQKDFVTALGQIGKKINDILPIQKDETDKLVGDTLVRGANYSLEAGGKRIRPLLAYAMGKMGYGLKEENLKPLLRSIEYMHTASLIFDDLPTEDNADLRRGRPTLHKHLGDPAAAELAGLFIIMKATEEQASLRGFDSARVQKLIKYSSHVIQDMCKGQYMDLESKNKKLSLEQLEGLCFLKTGIAMEASLIMPAILANAPEKEMEAIRKFARHAGIAFQIKDDILDQEGDPEKMGKAVGMDSENNNSTFVTILGMKEAKNQLYDNYFQALAALDNIPRDTKFLKQVLNYIVNRDR